MGESEAIAETDRPVTTASLVADLRALGVVPGMTAMVHSSLSRLGWVAGGAHAVVAALREAVGDEGTLMMPTHSSQLSDPAAWQNPPVPESWWAPIRAETPAYDPALTPTEHMGRIVECFRHVPGVRRSAHPTVSAAAVGPNAAALIDGHQLAHGLGETSPQARLYELDGHILLLGVTHANNTSLHLAENRAAPSNAAIATYGSPVMVDGHREWTAYPNLVDSADDFERIGTAFASETGRQRTGPVGAGTAHLMHSRDVVDFAVDWLRVNRTWATH
ncbi:MAG TPA: AAC(3) family N-acetyltransferase [Ilumatobacteraceae bacterium]|nr:AAC(3) family N-acetyltransferase [Ilumatobacteraceae bacterium]